MVPCRPPDRPIPSAFELGIKSPWGNHGIELDQTGKVRVLPHAAFLQCLDAAKAEPSGKGKVFIGRGRGGDEVQEEEKEERQQRIEKGTRLSCSFLHRESGCFGKCRTNRTVTMVPASVKFSVSGRGV